MVERHEGFNDDDENNCKSIYLKSSVSEPRPYLDFLSRFIKFTNILKRKGLKLAKTMEITFNVIKASKKLTSEMFHFGLAYSFLYKD